VPPAPDLQHHFSSTATPHHTPKSKYDLLCHNLVLPFPKLVRGHDMEPIVLLGLIVVVYGGYVALLDLREDLSACFPRRLIKVADHCDHRGRNLKSPIEKMAGMHI